MVAARLHRSPNAKDKCRRLDFLNRLSASFIVKLYKGTQRSNVGIYLAFIFVTVVLTFQLPPLLLHSSESEIRTNYDVYIYIYVI